jgi:cell division protein FtsA
MVATPYASGLAALVSDELEMGCAAIDMGGGTTTVAVFSEGKLVHADAIALGGHHVTMDLARGLSTAGLTMPSASR